MGKSAIILRPGLWQSPPAQVIPRDFDNYFFVGKPGLDDASLPPGRCRALVTDHPGRAIHCLLIENQALERDIWLFGPESAFKRLPEQMKPPLRAAAIAFCPVRDLASGDAVLANFENSPVVFLPWSSLRWIDFNKFVPRNHADLIKEYAEAANRLGFSSYLAPIETDNAPHLTLADYMIDTGIYDRECRLFHKSRLLNVIKSAPVAHDRDYSLLIDLSHVRPAYNGTMEVARNLVPRLIETAASLKFLNISLLGNPEYLQFHGIPADRCIKSDDKSFYDICYRPYQVDSAQAFSNIVFRARRLVISQLDVIGCRCEYIYDSAMRFVQQAANAACDGVAYISEFARGDVAEFFGGEIDPARHRVIPLAMEEPARHLSASGDTRTIVIVGSWRYDHKMLRPTLAAIREIAGSCTGVIFHFVGDLSREEDLPSCVRFSKHDMSAAALDDLFASASAFVYPSVYEGFGLPIMHALRFGRPVLASDTAVNRELQSLVGGTQFHSFSKTSQLSDSLLKFVLSVGSENVPLTPRNWDAVAVETCRFLVECIRVKPADSPYRRAHREALILCHEAAMAAAGNARATGRAPDNVPPAPSLLQVIEKAGKRLANILPGQK